MEVEASRYTCTANALAEDMAEVDIALWESLSKDDLKQLTSLLSLACFVGQFRWSIRVKGASSSGSLSGPCSGLGQGLGFGWSMAGELRGHVPGRMTAHKLLSGLHLYRARKQNVVLQVEVLAQVRVQVVQLLVEGARSFT